MYINKEFKFLYCIDFEDFDFKVFWFEVCFFKFKGLLFMVGIYCFLSLKVEYDYRLDENI